MKRLLPLILCLLMLAGCSLEQAKQAAAEAGFAIEQANAEIDALKAELEALPPGDPLAERLVGKIESTEQWRDTALVALNTANENIQAAEDGGDVIAGLIGAGLTLIPGGLVFIPVLNAANRWRRHFRNTVQAIADGGGPAVPDHTRASMSPETRLAVRKERERIGAKTRGAPTT